MDYIDFNMQMARQEISSTKRVILVQRSALYLNNILAIWLIFNLYLHPTYIITAITAGICICNVLWTASQLGMSKMDLKNDQDRLCRLQEHVDSEVYKGAQKQYEESKKYFDDYVKYQQSVKT